MIGAIIGDIVGSRFEFDCGPWTKDFEFVTSDSSWTDDTVMTIAISEALLSAGTNATTDVIKDECIKSMQKWGKAHIDAGYGLNFIQWIQSNTPKPYGSYGNGSAMRVSATGRLYDSLERTLEVAKATAEVTHNHPEGIKGAQCTAAVMYLARTGSNKQQIRDYVVKNFDYDITASSDELRPLHRHDESCMDSLPKALISFFEGLSFEDVIRTAVSLGGDTDTIAAIAGAMAGAYYDIPQDVVDLCKSKLTPHMIERLDKFDVFTKMST